MKFTSKILALSLLLVSLSFGQVTTTQTPLASAMTVGAQTVNLTSSTGVSALGSANQVITRLFIDGEDMDVLSNVNAAGTGNVWNVRRGNKQTAHASGATVYVGPPGYFDNTPKDLTGACTAANVLNSPRPNIMTGNVRECFNGQWGRVSDGMFYVPPTQCTFTPTTLTVTNTYPQVGASNVFVLKGISNAAAGTMTLTCNILVPTRVTALKGAQIKDITLLVASSATGSGVVPTSLGTSTLGSITFPTASTTETASTITPVATGGTVTTVSPTAFLSAVSTDGAFFTFKHTYSTAVDLSTDLRILQYTMPILQSAASVSTLYTPGLIVHYRAVE